MGKTTQVYLRDKKKSKTVSITNDEKPVVLDNIVDKWQSIINLIANVLDVPSGLLMKINEENIEVLVKSNNLENPYKVGDSDSLGHGLYCESVIGNDDELLIENALKMKSWKDNPDVKLNMISYYGLPIKWPDKEFYGTICVLDDKEKKYSEDYKELVKKFRDYIEKDLELLIYQKELKYHSEMDSLTALFNRRKCESILNDEFNRSTRTSTPFSVALIDLDNFKSINDNFGHDIGDEILQLFSKEFKARIRSIDSLGRWGGDEFLLICPNTDHIGIETLVSNIKSDIVGKMHKIISYADFSYGSAEFDPSDASYDAIISRADKKMYEQKSER